MYIVYKPVVEGEEDQIAVATIDKQTAMNFIKNFGGRLEVIDQNDGPVVEEVTQ